MLKAGQFNDAKTVMLLQYYFFVLLITIGLTRLLDCSSNTKYKS
jgi:hypothetical protein